MDAEIAKLNKIAAQVRTGGKGSSRRKTVVKHKNTVDDRKQVAKMTKTLGVRPIVGIEEANLFKNDGNVIHFAQPKVAAAAKTFVISGPSQDKPMQELLPGILSQLGGDNLNTLKKLAEQFAKNNKVDDDVPELVGNFEQSQ